MPGPLPALATAATLLAAPAGVGAPPADPSGAPVDAGVPMPRLTDPAAASTPDGGAMVAWSAPGAVEGRAVDGDGRPTGPQAQLGTRAGRPALLARADGRLLMSYSGDDVRVRVVGAAGPVGDEHVLDRAIDTRQVTRTPPRAPTLAWGPGRRWAIVAWARPNPRPEDDRRPDTARVLARRVTPDGVPLGKPIVVARRVVQGSADGADRWTTWESATPTAATDGDRVLVVWEDGASARLRGARIDVGGHVRRAALGLTAVAQRRALDRRVGTTRETTPLLLTRPGRRPLLAWGATLPHGGTVDDPFRGALLVAAVPLRGRPSVADGPHDLLSTDAETPTSLVSAADGTLTVTWRVEEEILAGRGCFEGDAGPPLGRRLDATLHRLGPRRPLSTGQDPRGPDVLSASGACSQSPNRAVLTRIAGGTLAVYPYAPYLDARVIPD